MMRSWLKRGFRSVGYEVSRYDYRRDTPRVRQSIMDDARIEIVLDVGANAGQFGHEIRQSGFGGDIASFEPLSTAFAALGQAAGGDPRWKTYHCALGSRSGTASINIAGNSWSSSLLPMLEGHLQAAPESAYVGTEQVTIRTLDEVYEEIGAGNRRAFMKIDTQGFTMEVLGGAQRSLPQVAGLQIELSLAPLYASEPLIGEVINYLYERQFRLVYVCPEFTDARGRQLQVNGIFVRS